MNDNAPTPQDDADRVCSLVSTTHSLKGTLLDSFEEIGKAAAKFKYILSPIYPGTRCNNYQA